LSVRLRRRRAARIPAGSRLAAPRPLINWHRARRRQAGRAVPCCGRSARLVTRRRDPFFTVC